MLIYNVNGTVTDIQINAIVDGKITSSVVTPSNISDSFNAATASATITNAITYASSSAIAYGLGYPTNLNPTNTGYAYKSSATIDRLMGYYTQSGIIVSSSNQAIKEQYPTNPNLHTRGQVIYHVISNGQYHLNPSTPNNRAKDNVNGAEAFALKYPTDKSNWSTINGVLTSPKNQ